MLIALRLAALVIFDGPRLTSLARMEHTGEVALGGAARPTRGSQRRAACALGRDAIGLRAAGAIERRHATAARVACRRTRNHAPELEAKLHRKAPFVWLRRHLPPAQAQAVETLGLDGVGALSEYKRFYPESTLAAPVVGLAGMDGQGLSGLELQYDRLIRGEPVVLRFYHDALGHPIFDSPLALKTPRRARAWC